MTPLYKRYIDYCLARCPRRVRTLAHLTQAALGSTPQATARRGMLGTAFSWPSRALTQAVLGSIPQAVMSGIRTLGTGLSWPNRALTQATPDPTPQAMVSEGGMLVAELPEINQEPILNPEPPRNTSDSGSMDDNRSGSSTKNVLGFLGMLLGLLLLSALVITMSIVMRSIINKMLSECP